MFNSNILFNNIAFLLKNSDKKVGELESASGVSTGYISRTSKGSGANPSIEFVYSVAKFFDVGIDLLISVDLGKVTETELYISKFIDKLIRDTNSNKLDWNIEKANNLNNLEPDINGYVQHDLFSYETFFEKSEIDYPNEISDVRFNSDSYGLNTYIRNDCYNLNMKNYKLYVMNINKSVYNTREKGVCAIEIWMVPNRGNSVFLVKDLNNPIHESLINILYGTISEYAKKPKIDKDAKNAIDAYLYYDDLDDDSFESSGIPF